MRHAHMMIRGQYAACKGRRPPACRSSKKRQDMRLYSGGESQRGVIPDPPVTVEHTPRRGPNGSSYPYEEWGLLG